MEDIEVTNKIPNTLSFLYTKRNNLKEPINILFEMANFMTVNQENFGRIIGYNGINEFFEIYINIYQANIMGVYIEEITRLFRPIEEIYCKTDSYLADTHAVCTWIYDDILCRDNRYDNTPSTTTKILTDKFINIDYNDRLKQFQDYFFGHM